MLKIGIHFLILSLLSFCSREPAPRIETAANTVLEEPSTPDTDLPSIETPTPTSTVDETEFPETMQDETSPPQLTGRLNCQKTEPGSNELARVIGCRFENLNGEIIPLDNGSTYNWSINSQSPNPGPTITSSNSPEWQQLFVFEQPDVFVNLSEIGASIFHLEITQNQMTHDFSFPGANVSFNTNPCDDNNVGIGFQFEPNIITVTSINRFDGTNQASFWIEDLAGLTAMGSLNTIGVGSKSNLVLTGSSSVVFVKSGGIVTAEASAVDNIIYYAKGAMVEAGSNKKIMLPNLDICKTI